jgi:type I restriction enzyme, S subunit
MSKFDKILKELQIDKSNWLLTSFGDVAIQQKKNVDRENTDLNKYVKGEHMGSEDLHIRSWGELDEEYLGPAFIRRFEKGDILYGSRRTYLRKVVIAPFSGITSNTTFVIKANEDNIDKRLLPFILLSEAFTEHSIKNSKGSVNPYINWKDISKYEFLLPPKKDQAKLAELLWSIDEINENYLSLKNKYDIYFERLLNDLVSGKLSKNKLKWREYIFGDLGETFGGLSGKIKTDFGEGSPFITYMNIFNNSKVNPDKVDLVKVGDNENQNKLKYGDILLTGSSETPQELGLSSVILDEMQTCYLNSFCFGFRLHNFDALLPEFARYLMRGQHVRKFMFKHAQGSTRFNLSKITVKTKLKITLPDIDEQKKIYEKLDSMEQCVLDIKNTIKRSENLRKSLINQIF